MLGYEPNRARLFDPRTASEALRALARRAEEHAKNQTELGCDFAHEAIEALQRAQAWVAARLVEFDLPAGKPLVTGEEEARSIGIDALVCTLRYAAVELVQIQKLVDLPAFRKKESHRQ